MCGGKSFSSFVLILWRVVAANKFIRRKELSWLRPKGNIPCRFYIIHSRQEIETHRLGVRIDGNGNLRE